MKRKISFGIAIGVFISVMMLFLNAYAFELPNNSYWITQCTCEEPNFTMTYCSKGSCNMPELRDYTCENCGGLYFQYIYYQHSYEKVFSYPVPKTTKQLGQNGYSQRVCKTCNTIEPNSYKTIYYPNEYKLSQTSYTYNGKAKKPSVTILDCNGNTIDPKFYTVKYSNNTKPGKATATITFCGDYSGTISKIYKIKPTKVTLSSAKYNSTGKITASWKKNTTGTGYILQYSTSSSFAQKNTCTIIIGNNTTVSKAITSLPAKKYYVRVASYVAVGSSKYRSAWSDTKAVTVKKGATLKQMINSTKTDLSGRKDILNATYNGVDIKKYSTTYDRMKAIYNWHSKNNTKYFANCMECNASFNTCIYYLFGTKNQYDNWVWMAAGNFKNSNGSIVIHKWSVLYIKGVPYIFDPRLQGYASNKVGNDYFGIPSSSSMKKRYLFDGWMFYWSNNANTLIV